MRVNELVIPAGTAQDGRHGGERLSGIIFVLRRLVNYVVLCLAVVFLTYLLASLSFDPIALLLHHDPPPSAAFIQDKVRQLHLDESIPRRFASWFRGPDATQYEPLRGRRWTACGSSTPAVVHS
ncbi:MAG TPA: hypothetical protein VGG05_06385 [Pseudonocardiaceae bacterium]